MSTVELRSSGSGGAYSRDGYRYVRLYRVTGLTGAEAEQPDEAVQAVLGTTGALGTAYSATRTTTVLAELVARLNEIPNSFDVLATYEDATNERDDPRLGTSGAPAFNTGIERSCTTVDNTGAVMTIAWSGTLQDIFPGIGFGNPVNFSDVVEAIRDEAKFGFTLTRRETDISTMVSRAQTYSAHVNTSAWNGGGSGVITWPARTVKCDGIDLAPVNEAEWRAVYKFSYDPDTWDMKEVPRPWGRVPHTLTPGDISTFSVQPERDFNLLPVYI